MKQKGHVRAEIYHYSGCHRENYSVASFLSIIVSPRVTFESSLLRVLERVF